MSKRTTGFIRLLYNIGMDKPIGVFDSGLGGLTVVREIKKTLPNESVVYLGDTARVPYGTRSGETIIKFALQCAEFLVKQEIKAVVIACNTASAYAYEEIKKRLPVPVFEVIKSGAISGVRGVKKVGVIGTQATIKSRAYEKEILKLNPETQIMNQVCPLFVPMVEAGETEGKLISLTIEKYLEEMKDWGPESLILGCTHYPVIARNISHYIGNKVKIINPGEYLARELEGYLNRGKMSGEKTREDKYFFTDVGQDFSVIAERFLGGKLAGEVRQVNLE